MSSKFTIRTAERRKAKLRVGLAGPSGSGKTYSALLLARGIASDWDKIGLIDTENGSGDLYSHMGAYKVITLDAPFSPETYVEALHAFEEAGVEVVILDSITHEWKHCLELVDKLKQSTKNEYTVWGRVTPAHDRFIDTIIQSPCHIITTVRSKQDYAMSKDENGKTRIEKVGMKQEQREGFEYELTVSFDIAISHLASASKDRTGLFANRLDFQITEAVGREIATWNESGVDPAVERDKLAGMLADEIESAEALEDLKTAFEHVKSAKSQIGQENIDRLSARVKERKVEIERSNEQAEADAQGEADMAAAQAKAEGVAAMEAAAADADR